MTYDLHRPVTVGVGRVKVARFWPKVGHIGTKWDKSETFEVNLSVHYGSLSQNVLKIIFKNLRYMYVLFVAKYAPLLA